MPSVALGGLTIVQFGQALAPANLSATQASALGLLMSGICGPTGSNSSSSAALQTSLENRLRARTAWAGSTLFTLTWKRRATPSGLQICALRASARRTSDSVCSLPLNPWPTPNARDFKCGPTETYAERSGTTKGDSLSNLVTAVCSGWRSSNVVDAQLGTRKGEGQVQLCHQAVLASWSTPRAEDAESSGMRWGRGVADTLTAQASLGSWATPKASDGRGEAYEPDPDCRRVEMRKQVSLAGWPTPMAGTPAQNGNSEAGNNDSSRRTVDLCTVPQGPARLTATGQLLTGSSAETASGGQLNPGHSRWLMGLPSVWDACGVTAMQSLRKSPKSSSRRTSTSSGV